MDIFFTILRKTIVATVCLVFAFVVIYIPQDWNQIEEAHALTGDASERTQLLNLGQLGEINVAATLSAAYDKVTSFASNSLFTKEFTLDGIAWALAKGIVSSMVQSLINWINSGFEGSPAFVTDLGGFLRNAGDEAIGQYLESLGGVGSFICSPFRLDVQIAVALQYERIRVNQPAPTCTLTGIIDNIEGFLGGGPGSCSQGGWNDWVDISAAPNQYTPFGQVLAGQAGARAVLINARGEEFAKLDFGDGFLSGEICEVVSGSTREDCWISKPGKIIQEALTFNIDSSRQALITADEIDEVISALLGQLAQKALTGTAGLLGLSGGNPHSYNQPYTGYNGITYNSYVESMSAQAAEGNGVVTSNNAVNLMRDTRAQQAAVLSLANVYIGRFTDKRDEFLAAANPTTPTTPTFGGIPTFGGLPIVNYEAKADEAQGYIDRVQAVANVAQNRINTLDAWIADYPRVPVAEKSQILSSYTSARYYTDIDRSNYADSWANLLSRL